MSSSSRPVEGRVLAERYRVERVLGKGGMGAVYAVTDLGTGRPGALKVLSVTDRDSIRELFEREYRTLASLRHPGIVEAYEYGICEEGPYYTMEILEGEDLSCSAPMPWRQVCRTLRDAASVLGVLHARRLVHRDLSPRNLWRTTDGRIVLLDFGAMVPFGIATDVVGTPPVVPPEALEREPLDARSDLYALGALGYRLLTSTHAYRARALGELIHAWRREPAVPSELVRLIEGADDGVPADLDELLLSLLAVDRNQRPANTTEVIDRLNAIAGLEPERHEEVISGYLESKAFVGRRSESRSFQRQRALAGQGVPTAAFVEGPDGIGRSRLLEEAALAARIGGMITVWVGREAGREPFAGAAALMIALLRALPTLAREAARPHVAVLAGLSEALGVELGGDDGPSPEASDRVERQAALHDVISDLCRQRPLAIVVDDAHLLDEESQAVLAALALAERGHRLHLVVSSCSDADLEEQANLRALQRSSRTMTLGPLSGEDTAELLRSTFNDVSYLERLAARLHEEAEGNPRDTLLFAEHLVRTGQIRYADGAWTLPSDLHDIALPSRVREEGLQAAFGRLSPQARRLARCLSVPNHGDFPAAEAAAAAAMPVVEALELLQELLRERVLQVSASGYSLVHERLREARYAELSEDDRKQIHRALAEHLSDQPGDDPVRALRTVVHWLRAGDVARAEPLLLEVGLANTMGTTYRLRYLVPMFADAVQLLRAHGRDDHALYLPLAALTYAGINVHPSYGEKFETQALDALSRGLRLPLAKRLEPLLGAKLSLLVALGVAAVELRLTPLAPPFGHLVYCLVASVASAAGRAGMFLDPGAVRRASAVLRKLGSLKRSGAIQMVSTVNEGIALDVEGRTHACGKVLGGLVEQLESPSALADVREKARVPYLCCSHLIVARNDALAHEVRCLEGADRLDAANKTGHLALAVIANQVRALYWSNMGQVERAAAYRREMELGAIQAASVWQVEIWEPAMQILSFADDAAAMKRASLELERLAASFPHIETYARWTRAAYLVLRGRYARALELYQGDAEPDGMLRWAAARAWFARAMNGEGRHEEARALCTATLDRLSPEDRDLVFHGLRLEVELAVAEAGLGRADAGHSRLDALFVRYCPQKGPLVTGLLHCSRARLDLLDGELEACHRSLEEAEKVYGPLRIASLGERVGAMRRAASFATERTPDDGDRLLTHGVQDSHMLTRVQLYLSANDVANDTKPHAKALRLALELANAECGFILETSGCCVAHDGGRPAPEVIRWAEGLLHDSVTEDSTEVLEQSDSGYSTSSEGTLEWEGTAYRMLRLCRRDDDRVFAAIVLGSGQAVPAELPFNLRVMFSDYLAEACELAKPA